MKKYIFGGLIILGFLSIPLVIYAADFIVAEYQNTTAGANCLINPVIENSTQGRACAQSFIGKAGSITTVEFTMDKTGSPTGQLIFSLNADDGGNPSATKLTSASIDSSSLSPTFTAVTVNLPFTMASGTTYWLVVSSTDAISNSDYTEIQPSQGGYADGVGKIFTGGSWTTSTKGDMIFKIMGDYTAPVATSTSGEDLSQLSFWNIAGALFGVSAFLTSKVILK
jgi:hypothetical protein